MKFDLDVHKRTLSGLFEEHPKLEIPDFQRPYEWETEHWTDLWDDITGHLDDDYLMGGIVLCGNESRGDLVIDGQQRLSTITLLLASCRDYLYREVGNEKAKQAALELHKDYIVSGGVVAEKNEPYVTLGEVDREWFLKKIQASPADPNFSPPELEIITNKIPSSNRLLWKAYRFFYQQLKSRHSKTDFVSVEAKVADVIRIARQLSKKTWFIVTRVPDDTQAYTFFEVLNDRGLELSISDLIKNVVLSRAAQQNRLQDAKDAWGEIIETLDYENVAAFLRYHWMSTNGKKVTENDLFRKLKAEIVPMNGPTLVTYLSKLSEEAGSFAEIIGRAKTSEEIARELGYISSYGFRVGHTVLLAVWATTNDKKDRLQVLRAVKSFLVKFAIFANQVTNELESEMAEIASALRSDITTGLKELDLRFKKLLPKKQVVEEGFLGLEPSISVGRALLIEFECHIAGTEKFPSGPGKVNVEHVFPQSPRGAWRSAFAAKPDECEIYSMRLGNLTLLDEKLNKQASNKPFADKVKNYYKKSDFKITQQLKKSSSWNVQAVKKRQADFYKLAREIWRIE